MNKYRIEKDSWNPGLFVVIDTKTGKFARRVPPKGYVYTNVKHAEGLSLREAQHIIKHHIKKSSKHISKKPNHSNFGNLGLDFRI